MNITGSTARVPGAPADPHADLTLAAAKLNYRPSIPLGYGLRLTLQRDSRFRG